MNNFIKFLIKEEIRILLEQAAKEPEPTTDSPTPEPSAPELTAQATMPGPTQSNASGEPKTPDLPTDQGTQPIPGSDGATSPEIGPDGEEIPGGEESDGGLSDFSVGGGLGGGGGFGVDGDSGGGDSSGEDMEPGEKQLAPPSEPEKRADDPVGAAMDEAKKAAKLTTDPQQVLNAIKASIQVNFSNYKDAWPIVKQLRATNDKLLDSVADRLMLFIVGL